MSKPVFLNPTFQASVVIRTPQQFKPCTSDAEPATGDVALVKGSGKRPPSLHFAWNPVYFLDNISEAEGEKLITIYGKKNVKALPLEVGLEPKYSMYLQQKNKKHVWFSYHDKRGWYWTEDTAGEDGWVPGWDFERSAPIFPIATSWVEDIQHSAIASYYLALGKGVIPEWFNHQNLHFYIERMLKHAYDNADFTKATGKYDKGSQQGNGMHKFTCRESPSLEDELKLYGIDPEPDPMEDDEDEDQDY